MQGVASVIGKLFTTSCSLTIENRYYPPNTLIMVLGVKPKGDLEVSVVKLLFPDGKVREWWCAINERCSLPMYFHPATEEKP